MVGVVGFGSSASITNYMIEMQLLIGNSGNSLQVDISYKGSHISGSSESGSAASEDSIAFSIKATQQLANRQKELGADGSASAEPDAAASAGNGLSDVFSDPTSVFRNYVNSLGGPAKFGAGPYSDQDLKSFVKAFDDGTVTVQSAVDVKGLDYEDDTTLTGSGGWCSLSYNHDWYNKQATPTMTGDLIEFPGIGGLFYTFPRTGTLHVTA